MGNRPVIRLTPGPVSVPDFVMEAIAKPVIHHRSQEFRELFAEIQRGMKYFFQTDGDVLCLTASGSQAMEMTLASLFASGEKVLVTVNGKFGERWEEWGQGAGLELISCRKPWGEAPTTEEVIGLVQANPGLKGLVLTHCDTSTGVVLDLEEIAFQARLLNPDLIIVADAISTVGILPFYARQWGIDAAVASSPKSLLNPSGTAFIAISERAAKIIARGKGACALGTYFWALKEGWFPYTAPTHLLFGIQAALEYIQGEGLPRLWNQAHQLSRLVKTRLPQMGAELVGQSNSDSLTVFRIPDRDADDVRGILARDFGIELSGGQGPWQGEVMRIAHFGPVGLAETKAFLQALAEVVEG